MPFLLALQFLTRIPVQLTRSVTMEQLRLSVLYYPLIGLLLGGILLGSSVVLSHLAIATQAAVLLALWVLLTGGLHLDGLADCADGWAGGFADKQRSLAIMQDPTVGALAVVMLILVLLLKWTCLQTVIVQQNHQALWLAPLLGRCAILGLMLSTPYIRAGGLGSQLTDSLPRSLAFWILFICGIIAIATHAIIPLLCAVLMLLGVRYLAMQRLGGVTGDVYGAAVELVEVAVLVGGQL